MEREEAEELLELLFRATLRSRFLFNSTDMEFNKRYNADLLREYTELKDKTISAMVNSKGEK